MKQKNQYLAKIRKSRQHEEESIWFEANDIASANGEFKKYLITEGELYPLMWVTRKLCRAYKSSNAAAYTPASYDTVFANK